jgi:hypothetical protein
MRQVIFILTITLFSFISCEGQALSNSTTVFVDTTKPFKKEIPKYQNGTVSIFYELAKAKQNQLGLDSIENGFENLQIRVWYDFALVRERKLVVIKNEGTNWTATVYYLQVNWDGKTETILKKKIKQVMPKSGWTVFSKKLLDLQILTLPNQRDIEGYSLGTDGKTYNVEIATKNQYRFYGYWEPQEYQDRFWQAKNMTDILNLFETELGV